jgi:hypothetical protein
MNVRLEDEGGMFAVGSDADISSQRDWLSEAKMRWKHGSRRCQVERLRAAFTRDYRLLERGWWRSHARQASVLPMRDTRKLDLAAFGARELIPLPSSRRLVTGRLEMDVIFPEYQ